MAPSLIPTPRQSLLGRIWGGIRGAPGLLGRGIAGVAPRLFGADPSVEWRDPNQQAQQLRNAMATAGTAMAVAGGGPRTFGQFGPDPIASVLSGLNAGRESYQQAQEGERALGMRNKMYAGLLGRGFQQDDIMRAYLIALQSGDAGALKSLGDLLQSPAFAARDRYQLYTNPETGEQIKMNLSTGETEPVAGGAAPSGQPRLTKTQRELVTRLSTRFDQDVGKHDETARAYAQVQSALSRTNSRNGLSGTDAYDLLRNFAAMVSPMNMRAQNQFEAVQQYEGMLGKLRDWFEQLRTGGIDAQRVAEIAATAQDIAMTAAQRRAVLRAQYERALEQNGVPGTSLIAPDPFAGLFGGGVRGAPQRTQSGAANPGAVDDF